ncbi:Orc1-type DNA replication protein [Haloferax mucosum ATCC BAA-1512]|uniref:Orc1-type DNA replication protein n=1 Tax=Haloferax mucosum ATCC BAA-1512 TaxID=662479 RepID=M0IJV7_9EURY|nr:AAA family ATPase [Haloferax mucosum]ELZ97010.1 Orc1-type DNA replication protein [Haloferax mucosum ATCC BAA-1512]
MNIESRIKRRQRRDGEQRLVLDYEPLSPTTHLDEPVNCGPVLERLLDHIDPVFDGTLPPNAYLYGPKGAGKSAVVTTLFERLSCLSTTNHAAIHTTTRVRATFSPEFVYVDTRQTTSGFAFYHAVLDAIVDDDIPRQGVKTETLQSRLQQVLERPKSGVVLAVDHLGEPGTIGDSEFIDICAGLPSNISWIAISRTEPSETPLTDYTAAQIEIERYQRQVLVDVLMTRASAGGSRQSLDHRLACDIADWADGDAHDALAALFGAADSAMLNQHATITAADVNAGIEAVPRPGISLGRAFALPTNRQRVLRHLLELQTDQPDSVREASERISESVSLSAATIKRILYELAEDGIVRRVTAERTNRKGRPPSRLEPCFPTVVFERLFALNYATKLSDAAQAQ